MRVTVIYSKTPQVYSLPLDFQGRWKSRRPVLTFRLPGEVEISSAGVYPPPAPPPPGAATPLAGGIPPVLVMVCGGGGLIVVGSEAPVLESS